MRPPSPGPRHPPCDLSTTASQPREPPATLGAKHHFLAGTWRLPALAQLRSPGWGSEGSVPGQAEPYPWRPRRRDGCEAAAASTAPWRAIALGDWAPGRQRNCSRPPTGACLPARPARTQMAWAEGLVETMPVAAREKPDTPLVPLERKQERAGGPSPSAASGTVTPGWRGTACHLGGRGTCLGPLPLSLSFSRSWLFSFSFLGNSNCELAAAGILLSERDLPAVEKETCKNEIQVCRCPPASQKIRGRVGDPRPGCPRRASSGPWPRGHAPEGQPGDGLAARRLRRFTVSSEGRAWVMLAVGTPQRTVKVAVWWAWGAWGTKTKDASPVLLAAPGNAPRPEACPA